MTKSILLYAKVSFGSSFSECAFTLIFINYMNQSRDRKEWKMHEFGEEEKNQS